MRTVNTVLARKPVKRGSVEVDRLRARHALALELGAPARRAGGVDAEPAPVIVVRIAIERRDLGQDQHVPSGRERVSTAHITSFMS
jgi:hypothetical protein